MFKLELVKRNDDPPLTTPIPVYKNPEVPPSDTLVTAYNDAFQKELRKEPGLVIRTFRATPSHRINGVFLAKLRQEVQEQFAVRKVGNSIKFIDRGHETNLKAIERAKAKNRGR